VLIQFPDAAALVAGDALYTLRHLDPDAVASFNYFGPQGLATYQDSVRRIGGLSRQRDELVLVVPHDPFDYNLVHTRHALADGRLSPEERTLLRAEQAKLFDAEGRLRPAARPRWDAEREQVVADLP
jgi:hypothetical protein